jgi:hypothetical protein
MNLLIFHNNNYNIITQKFWFPNEPSNEIRLYLEEQIKK